MITFAHTQTHTHLHQRLLLLILMSLYTHTHTHTHKPSLIPKPTHLQWILGADSDDMVLVGAELAAPGASLTDPFDEARLVCALHRPATAARAEQLPLQDTHISSYQYTQTV